MNRTGHPALAAAHAGDPAALRQLLSTSQRDIRRYAYRHCFISDVDDAVQETLLVLSRKLAALRVLAAYSGWLMRIVRRECHRLGRLALAHDPWDDSRAEQWLGSQDDSSLRLEVAQALQSLPAPYREVLLLRDLEELTVAEIATRLSLTPAAVKSRLHRARSLAREHLLA